MKKLRTKKLHPELCGTYLFFWLVLSDEQSWSQKPWAIFPNDEQKSRNWVGGGLRVCHVFVVFFNQGSLVGCGWDFVKGTSMLTTVSRCNSQQVLAPEK